MEDRQESIRKLFADYSDIVGDYSEYRIQLTALKLEAGIDIES